MNTNLINIIALLIGSLSYAFVILLVFRLLRVNYFNPVVKSFVSLLNPITTIFTTLLGGINGIFVAAFLFKFISFYILANSAYENSDLLVYAAINVLSSVSQILLFAVIGGVILSWVAPSSPHPLLKLINEMSDKILTPIRNYLPSMGGLDFSPLLVLILLNQVDVLLASIARVLL
ncbi:YggT family protein [Gammaproteobacteria bacterium]|mgnify:FL=1|jgi:YggT family protein|nr:YggT family protein [Gammaproteobacteria bacterium]MDB4059794.1 YggT family protein [Gammaproteobacteria bacterium]MDB9997145.1 YggT family protein [Gammaproteobacteria bacterium]|tara:strand:+ start:1255 stop:1782 length:528 start_codon:yes stop_codon:yes gene_type:complete